MEMAKTIEALINEKGYNKKEFARIAGLPYTTLINILERGAARAGVSNVLKICDALGLKMEELVSISRPKKEQPPAPFEKDKLEAVMKSTGLSADKINKLSESDKDLIIQLVDKFLKDKDNS